MRKSLCLTVIFLLILMAVSVNPSEATSQIAVETPIKSFVNPTQPVGEIALKTIGIPNGTPAAARLSWSFNGFLENATSTSPESVLNISQVISADANKTISAGDITTPLTKVYAADNDPYRVPAKNETGNLYWSACFNFNFTLGNHYILNETWITRLEITVRGNASILADTSADLNVYNFTASAWKKLGEPLNTTTAQTHTYILTSYLDDYIDENHNNTIMIQFLWNDSSNTAYDVDIDYAAVTIYYNLTIAVNNWKVTQTNSTIALNKEEGTYTVNFWENLTLTAPSGITGHNFTLYIKPANRTYLTNHTLYVSGNKMTPTVTRGEVAENITNLVSNSTALNFNTKIEVKFLKTVLSGQYWCKDAPIRYDERQRVFNLTLTSNASAYYFENLTIPTNVPYADRVNATSTLGRPLMFIEGSATKIVINYMQNGEKETIKFTYKTTTKLRVIVVSSKTGLPIKGAKVTIDAGFEKRVGVTGSDGIVEFKTLVGDLSYTVTVEKGRESVEKIVDVEWDKTNQLTAALPIYVFPWWLPYLLLAVLILIVLVLLWKKKILTVRLPRITMPKISKPKLTVRRRKVKPFKLRLPKPSRKTLALILSLIFFVALYVSYSWRIWPFTTIPYTGETMLKISAIPVEGITVTPEDYLYPVRYIVVNPLNNMTISDHYVGTLHNPYVYVTVPKQPGYLWIAMITPEDFYLYEPLSSEYVIIDDVLYYKVKIPAPPLFQSYSERNAIKVTGEVVKVGNISIVDSGNITFASTFFTSTFIFELEKWTALYNATIKISLNVSGIILDSAKLNGTGAQIYHDDADEDGYYDGGEYIYVFLGNQTFLVNTEDEDVTYFLSLTFSNTTISSGQVMKATIEFYHYKFNVNKPFIFSEMQKITLLTTAAYYTKS